MQEKIISPGDDFVIIQSDRTYGSRPSEVVRFSGRNLKTTFSKDVSINGTLTLNGKVFTQPPTNPSGSGVEELSERGEFYAIGGNETWILEYLVDFSTLPANFSVSLTGFTKQDVTTGGTYIVRIGGTSGLADGPIAVILNTSRDTYINTPDSVTGATQLNLGSYQLVKLTAAGSSNLALARIKHPTIEIG